ncbi:MAG: sulfatase-like hydrolase/transferase [Phycisphaeraceae bacterium]|nr:sulfatase-like hydrolase/transferase [Phycisphaeraceae bacterium]
MKHHRIMKLLFALFICLPVVGSVSAEQSQPNILFILADDWGFGDLSCRGHETIETPNLDRLVDEGVDVQDFTVASGVCSPSRVAIMTGHFPARYRINQHFHHTKHHQKTGMPDWLDPDAPMLPRQLQQAGYATYHIGKWHLTGKPITDAPLPTAYGYDKSWVWNGPGPEIDSQGVWDKAIAVIEEQRDKPFFINLWLNETHTPHFPTQKWLDYYAKKGLDERERVYPAVVSNADEKIGRVLKALDNAGLKENTVVIFTSDNGPEYPLDPKGKVMNHPELGEGLNTWYSLGSAGDLKGKKRSLHQGGIRVPFVLRWPEKIKRGRELKQGMLTAVDLLPTLCGIAGAPLPRGYRSGGEDRSSILDPNVTCRTKPIFWYWPADTSGDNWPRAAIRDAGRTPWKLLMTLDGSRIELYDLDQDPQEKNNLADQYPPVVKRLKAQLETWLAELPDEPDPKCFSKLRK